MKKVVLYLFVQIFFLMGSAQKTGNFVFKDFPNVQTKLDILQVLDDEDFYPDSDFFFLKNEKEKDYTVRFSIGENDVLRTIEVMDIPKDNTWETLCRTYLQYRDDFQAHYGAPFDEAKTFADGVTPDYDAAKLDALRKGNCHYRSSFKVRQQWLVELSLSFDAEYKGLVSVVFVREQPVAEVSNGGMEFMKIPMEGSAREFARNLRTKGFVLNEVADGAATLEGRFAGYDHCQVFVLESDVSKQVRSVIVSFQHQKEWNNIMSIYTNLKNVLIEKYGPPANEKGHYGSTNHPEHPQVELRNIEEGRSEYSVVFRKPEGAIVLSITPALNVVLGYTDMRKWNENKKEAMDDL